MTWRVNFVRSKDAQKQLARMSLRQVYTCPVGLSFISETEPNGHLSVTQMQPNTFELLPGT